MQMGLEQGDTPELWNVEHPEKVKEGFEHATSVLNNFIEGGQQIDRSYTTLGTLKTEIEKICRPLSEKNKDLNFSAKLIGEDYTFQSDVIKIKEICLNLLNNSFNK